MRATDVFARVDQEFNSAVLALRIRRSRGSPAGDREGAAFCRELSKA